VKGNALVAHVVHRVTVSNVDGTLNARYDWIIRRFVSSMKRLSTYRIVKLPLPIRHPFRLAFRTRARARARDADDSRETNRLAMLETVRIGRSLADN
jgi:hypothetical protein